MTRKKATVRRSKVHAYSSRKAQVLSSLLWHLISKLYAGARNEGWFLLLQISTFGMDKADYMERQLRIQMRGWWEGGQGDPEVKEKKQWENTSPRARVLQWPQFKMKTLMGCIAPTAASARKCWFWRLCHYRRRLPSYHSGVGMIPGSFRLFKNSGIETEWLAMVSGNCRWNEIGRRWTCCPCDSFAFQTTEHRSIAST